MKELLSAESDQWLQAFSAGAYRPMLRLARAEDSAFVSVKRSAQMGRDYRRQQLSILREYLHSLARDYRRLLAILAARDRDHQPLAYFDSRLSFIFGMFWIEARIIAEAVIPSAIDLEPLLADVDSLARSTQEMARSTLRLHVT